MFQAFKICLVPDWPIRTNVCSYKRIYPKIDHAIYLEGLIINSTKLIDSLNFGSGSRALIIPVWFLNPSSLSY
jgi:hypothetical protein